MEIGVQVWRQYVNEIDGFLDEIEPEQGLSLSFAELVEEPADIAQEVAAFLGLPDARPLTHFLVSQCEARTPFSSPTSDLTELLEMQDPGDLGRAALEDVADLATRLGYSTEDARPERSGAGLRQAAD